MLRGYNYIQAIISGLLRDHTDAHPTEAEIHAIDGLRVDLRIHGSNIIVRNVPVIGDAEELQVGQTVQLRWEDERPIVLATTDAGSIPISVTIQADGDTLENSPLGLRVKQGGIRPWHLSFVPSTEGHTHQDIFQRHGWSVTTDGAIFQNDIFIHPDGQIVVGTGNDLIKLDSAHAIYRLWAGANDPAAAPFSVSKTGYLHASSGDIGGWDILTDKLSKSNIELDPSGQIKVGTGNDVAILNSINPDNWRFWIGHSDPAQAMFRVKKTGEVWFDYAHVTGDLESSNYVAGQQGWHADKDGWAEFQDVIVRGKIQSAVFQRDVISVISGRTRVSEGAVLIADVSTLDTTIDVDVDAFVQDDIIQLKPAPDRNEWMQITSAATPITGGYRYTVTRSLNGETEVFYSGETIAGTGQATYPMAPLPMFGDPDIAFGGGAFGGDGYTALGGFLTLDGNDLYGPYFGVALRHGAAYTQIVDIARLGRLKGFLGQADEHGVGIGDLNRYFLYTYRNGLEIKTAGGMTSIDDDGIASERFGLRFASSAPGYTNQYVRFWVDGNTHRIYANIKDGDYEQEVVWFDFDAGGAIADDADTVDGIHASSTPEANKLLALDAQGKLPADITGDADTVDGYHGSDLAKIVYSATEPGAPVAGMIWVQS